MFDSIKSLIGFRSGSILGVDIGTASIKIVEIVKKLSKAKIKKLWHFKNIQPFGKAQ